MQKQLRTERTWLFLQKSPCWVFEWVLNTPLLWGLFYNLKGVFLIKFLTLIAL